MNRRSELRLKVYSRAVVFLVDSPERESICSLTDISSAGFKLLSNESLPAGATAVVEVEDHLILVEIRHSEERNGKFAIGIERLHTLAKRGLPEHAAKSHKIQALIHDFHRKGTLDQELQELFAEKQIMPEPERARLSAAENRVTETSGPRPFETFHAIPQAGSPVVPTLAKPTATHFAAGRPIAPQSAIEPVPSREPLAAPEPITYTAPATIEVKSPPPADFAPRPIASRRAIEDVKARAPLAAPEPIPYFASAEKEVKSALPADFAAVRSIGSQRAIERKPEPTPHFATAEIEVKSAPGVEPPNQPEKDPFAWAEEYQEESTRRLLNEQKKLMRSRRLLIAMAAGAAIIALEAVILNWAFVVLVPRGYLNQSYRAPAVTVRQATR